MKRFLMTVGLYASTLVAMFAMTPIQVSAVDASCDASVFAIPAWYNGMMERDDSGDCAFQPITYSEAGTDKTDIVKTGAKISANLIRAALVLAAYTAVFFMIRGGFTYITSAGSPAGIAAAKKTITNALIGLVIAILAASIVNAIGSAIR